MRHALKDKELKRYRRDANGMYKPEDLTAPESSRRFEWRGTTPIWDGADGELRVAVTCLGDFDEGYMLVVQLLSGGRFRVIPDTETGRSLGLVEARWDNGPVETYTFRASRELLSLTDASKRGGWWDNHIGLTDRLKEHSELRLRVIRGRDTRVTDRISLADAARAIEGLPCTR